MLKKRILCLALAVLVLSGACAALAAGTSSDPLVSRSYAETWGKTVLEAALPAVGTKLNAFYETARAGALKAVATGAGTSVFTLNAGGTVTLATGASVTLLSGAATAAVAAGTLVNVTVGSAAGNGKLNRFHRYIACENTSVTVTVSEASVLAVDGSYTSSAGTRTFTDVKSGDWFYADVYNAVKSGLIDGMTDTTFVPSGRLTVAQAIVLAARMRQLYTDGKVTLTGSGAAWYQPYVDYAVAQGVVESAYASKTAAELSAPVSRGEYIHIFYKALPESEYPQLNSVADGAIPDVAMTYAYAAEIYAFYRAGILTGYEGGYFKPEDTIARSEVAAALTRMFDKTARQTFTLG